MTSEDKLLPCPFCGSSASWLDDRECQQFNEVSCNNSIQACVMPNFPMSATAWNTRATQPVQPSSEVQEADKWEMKYLRMVEKNYKLREEALQSQQWQPIETAPRDGTVILGCDVSNVHKPVFEMLWHEIWSTDGVFGWTDDYEALCELEPTHWMPLPATPCKN